MKDEKLEFDKEDTESRMADLVMQLEHFRDVHKRQRSMLKMAAKDNENIRQQLKAWQDASLPGGWLYALLEEIKLLRAARARSRMERTEMLGNITDILAQVECAETRKLLESLFVSTEPKGLYKPPGDDE